MSFRFWRRVRIAPGVTLNLSKSGGSLSFGPRGAKFTLGPRGRRATVGIPGTGLFYTTTFSGTRSGGRGRGHAAPTVPTVPPEDRLTLGFFRRLVTPDDEAALVDGCRELALGHGDKALELLEQAAHLADGACLAGFLALEKGRLSQAADFLDTAVEKHDRLGRYFAKYGISATMSLAVTDEVTVHVGPDLRGVLLGLVEIFQHRGRRQDAIRCLERLRRLEPDDVVVKLSLAELLLDTLVEDDPDRRAGRAGDVSEGREPEKMDVDVCKKVVRLAGDIGNETPIHAGLMLYKARALRRLGLATAARDTLTAAIRRKKGRPAALLQALRYERALAYGDLGNRSRALAELEKLYAEAPDYEDVAARLGL